MSTSADHPPGTLLGQKFKVLRLLGTGGMGAVYEIEHVFTKHRRALKLLQPGVQEQPHVVERFLREASAAGRIGNPHITETFDAGTLDDGSPYLVMELLEGQPLSDVLAARGRFELAELCELMRQAANGVRAAHDAGIVHRDLKPDNLFVVSRDGLPFVKVLDFGISKFDTSLTGDHGVTREGSMLGTPYYMSPEQVRGAKDIDSRADVYALGVILYQCASGCRPFDADTLTELALLIDAASPTPLEELRPDVPKAFSAMVHKAMAKRREDRFQSMGELAVALEAFLPTRLSRPPAPSSPPYSAGGTLLMSDTPPRSDIPLTPQGRPASLESAALGRTLFNPRRNPSRAYLAFASVIILAGVAFIAYSAVMGTRLRREQHAAQAPSGSSSVTAPPSPVVVPAAPEQSDAAARDADAPPAPHASHPVSPKQPRPPTSGAAKPGASASKSERHGLAQDNPYGAAPK